MKRGVRNRPTTTAAATATSTTPTYLGPSQPALDHGRQRLPSPSRPRAVHLQDDEAESRGHHPVEVGRPPLVPHQLVARARVDMDHQGVLQVVRFAEVRGEVESGAEGSGRARGVPSTAKCNFLLLLPALVPLLLRRRGGIFLPRGGGCQFRCLRLGRLGRRGRSRRGDIQDFDPGPGHRLQRPPEVVLLVQGRHLEPGLQGKVFNFDPVSVWRLCCGGGRGVVGKVGLHADEEGAGEVRAEALKDVVGEAEEKNKNAHFPIYFFLGGDKYLPWIQFNVCE